METIPTAEEWCALALRRAEEKAAADTKVQTSQEAALTKKSMWDAMAPRYAHKLQRSGYLAQLIERLDLQPGETVFDMGCGPGVLAIPLAQAGHDVFCVEFSDGMLAELDAAIREAGVTDKVHVFKRAWQEDWGGLPVADVAISSRSMTTSDFADAGAKLESKARHRVVVTLSAGETPWFDMRLRRATERGHDIPKAVAGLQEITLKICAHSSAPSVSSMR